jgi:hypothetical protein
MLNDPIPRVTLEEERATQWTGAGKSEVPIR